MPFGQKTDRAYCTAYAESAISART